ncbi:hypothetical protein Aduo_015733 [Ancylostoma duodenale]
MHKYSAFTIVLAASSTYMAAMYTPDMLKASQKNARIPNIDQAALRDLLLHAYGQIMDVSEENIQKVIVATNFVQMHEIVEKSAVFVFEHLKDDSNAPTMATTYVHESLRIRLLLFLLCGIHMVELRRHSY